MVPLNRILKNHHAMTKEPIFVTRPFLPPLEEYIPYLRKIWDNKILTNSGPFHQQLQQALREHLGVAHISLFANGTLALIASLKALDIKGSVITTPFSFVATAHSLLWSGIRPIFADIDPHTLNLDPAKIEAAIEGDTTAILPVHCYGHPCDAEGIRKIAEKHNLKIIYDAAHAFGVKDTGGSILRHGDLSILSFHATKVFNTFEGGAIICPDRKMKQHVDHLKNFGIADEVSIVAVGFNGKMNELNAAFGLLGLQHIDEALKQRRDIDAGYRMLLEGVKGIRCLEAPGKTTGNYGYFPILVQPEYQMSRDGLYEALSEKGIFARRYFFPLISEFSMYRDLRSAQPSNLPIASDTALKVLCLPIYPGLTSEHVDIICNVIRNP
jgi:dTDP-4-amino-4,6-dideoxygalactose transaminase